MAAQVIWHGARVERLTLDEAKEFVRRMTLETEREVKLLIGKKGLGKPSAPGQPPKRQTGALVSSYGHDFRDAGLLGIVGSNLKTSLWLEIGTRKMAARPHLRRSLNEVGRRWEKFIRGRV